MPFQKALFQFFSPECKTTWLPVWIYNRFKQNQFLLSFFLFVWLNLHGYIFCSTFHFVQAKRSVGKTARWTEYQASRWKTAGWAPPLLAACPSQLPLASRLTFRVQTMVRAFTTTWNGRSPTQKRVKSLHCFPNFLRFSLDALNTFSWFLTLTFAEENDKIEIEKQGLQEELDKMIAELGEIWCVRSSSMTSPRLPSE